MSQETYQTEEQKVAELRQRVADRVSAAIPDNLPSQKRPPLHLRHLLVLMPILAMGLARL